MKRDYFLSREKAIREFFVSFYIVGTVGMLVPLTFPLFLRLIPFALLLNFALLFVFHATAISRKIIFSFIAIYVLSFVAEAIGVGTGAIFGHYWYGSSLGIKLVETPLIIGINWFFLVYTTAAMVEKLRIAAWLKVVAASSLMLAYDAVLEQMAPSLDMWHWKNDTVPLQNYAAWFALALLFHTLLKVLDVQIKNPLSSLIFVCQFLFFLALLVAQKLLLCF